LRFVSCVKFVKLWFVVISLTPCVCIDVVRKILRRGRQGDTSDPHVWSVVIWICVLWPQMPFWRWLLLDVPITASTCIIQFLLICWHIAVLYLSTDRQRHDLVGHRIFMLLRRVMLEARQEPNAHRGELLRLCMDVIVLQQEWDRIATLSTAKAFGITALPQWFLCWHLIFHGFKLLQILREQGGAHMPWQLSPTPLHHGAPEMYCPVHNTCSICLENLCCTPDGLSLQTLDCSSGTVPVFKKWWSRSKSGKKKPMLATLRCQHVFHEECIASWRARPYTATCPTCLTEMVQDPAADIVVERHDVEMCIKGTCVMFTLLSAPFGSWRSQLIGMAAFLGAHSCRHMRHIGAQ